MSKHADKVGYLARMDVKFHAPVRPGAKLILYSEKIKKFGKLFQFKVKAMVEKKIIANGTIIVSEQ